MFKLVVLSALLAVAVASGIHGVAPLAYSHYAAPAVAVPSAVSYQSRTDVVSKPVVATYAEAAPVVAAYSAPAVAYSAPVVKAVAPAVAVPSAVSYQTRTDVVSKPVVATYAETAPVVAAYSAPVVKSVAPAVAVPSAVSYQSRTDVVSKPVVATYAAAAPVVAAYHAPLAYSAPVAYSTPVAYSAPVAYSGSVVAAAPFVKTVAQGATISSYTSPAVVESVAHGSPVVAAYSAPQYW